jgi:MOSC domain-containing protein YiiM
MGERWAVGTTVLEVSGVRIPCSVFQGFVGEPQWVRRFMERGLTGPYLRVLETGRVRAGDTIEVVHRPDHELTVGHVFRALTTQRELMPSLVGVPGLSKDVARRVEAWSAPGRGDRSVR